MYVHLIHHHKTLLRLSVQYCSIEYVCRDIAVCIYIYTYIATISELCMD